MNQTALALWIVEYRSDRAGPALDLALRLGAERLELSAEAWTEERTQRAEACGLEALAREGDQLVRLRDRSPVPLPPSCGRSFFHPDVFRRNGFAEFLASHPDQEWVNGPAPMAPAASVASHLGELRMQMVGAWVGGARGIRLGPWPGWSSHDPLTDPESPILGEIERLRTSASTLSQGSFRQEPAILLEPDDPDPEDLRRIYEVWLLLEMAGVHAMRMPASLAHRKALNRARLVLIPGCWRFSEERWQNLGGWVRGGGTLYLGFDERALAQGYDTTPGQPPLGPPGPDFLHKLVGREPVGSPPFPRIGEEKLRIRFRRNDEVFSEIRELHLHSVPSLPYWPLEEKLEGKRGRLPRSQPVQVLARGPGQVGALWRHRLLKGEVIASALPLEAILSRQAGGFGDGNAHGNGGERPMGPEISRFFFYLARSVGLVTGKAPLEPFTSLAMARGLGGYPHSLVVVNRRSQRCPGRLRLEVEGGFRAQDVQSGKPVALMKGQLVCPVDPWDYRVVSLERLG